MTVATAIRIIVTALLSGATFFVKVNSEDWRAPFFWLPPVLFAAIALAPEIRAVPIIWLRRFALVALSAVVYWAVVVWVVYGYQRWIPEQAHLPLGSLFGAVAITWIFQWLAKHPLSSWRVFVAAVVGWGTGILIQAGPQPVEGLTWFLAYVIWQSLVGFDLVWMRAVALTDC
jgi:hypothetical protein